MSEFEDDGGRIRQLVEADRIFPHDGLDLRRIREECGLTIPAINSGLLKATPIKGESGEDWESYTCQISGAEGEAVLVGVRILTLRDGEWGMITGVSVHHGGW